MPKQIYFNDFEQFSLAYVRFLDIKQFYFIYT